MGGGEEEKNLSRERRDTRAGRTRSSYTRRGRSHVERGQSNEVDGNKTKGEKQFVPVNGGSKTERWINEMEKFLAELPLHRP